MVLGLLLAAAAVFGVVHHRNKKRRGDRTRRGCAADRAAQDQGVQYRDDVKPVPSHDYYANARDNNFAPPPEYDQRWPNEYESRGDVIAGDNKVQMREGQWYGAGDEKAMIRREKSLREI